MSRRSNPTRTSKLAVSRLFTVDALALVEVSRVDVDESYAPAPLDGHGRGPAVFRHRVELATLRAGPPERIPLAPR